MAARITGLEDLATRACRGESARVSRHYTLANYGPHRPVSSQGLQRASANNKVGLARVRIHSIQANHAPATRTFSLQKPQWRWVGQSTTALYTSRLWTSRLLWPVQRAILWAGVLGTIHPLWRGRGSCNPKVIQQLTEEVLLSSQIYTSLGHLSHSPGWVIILSREGSLI